MSNSDNPRKGAEFQRSVQRWFQEKYNKEFELDKKIAIGAPAKLHKFDLVDEDNAVVVECKCYTWTETGNVPSAKMCSCNEAAFYLSFLPENIEKYIVMLVSRHVKREETLAEYYFRTNRHFLGKIIVAEYDPQTDYFRIVGQNK